MALRRRAALGAISDPYISKGLYDPKGPACSRGLRGLTNITGLQGPFTSTKSTGPATLSGPAISISALLTTFTPPPLLLLLLALLLQAAPLFPYSSEPDFLLVELWVELVPALDESSERAISQDQEAPYQEAPGQETPDQEDSAVPKPAFEGEIFPMQAAPLPKKEAVRRLLEEAIFLFSGMIYGFSLDYTPLDRERQVAEYFSANPVAQIPWGDPGLNVQATWRIEDKLYARIRYDLSPDQLRRRQAWSSAVHNAASASAIAPLNLGYRGRMEAHRLAIKEAFRNHLRSIERNKPRSTRGRCVIVDAPITSLSAGGYRSTIRIRLDVEEVNPYRR